MTEAGNAGRKFNELVGILETLRGPDGCPWDRAQTSRDIRDYFLEEVFEAVEALEAGDAGSLAEELGDVLMEVVFLSRIQEEEGAFTISDALDRIIAKMIARHPHVFAAPRDMTAAGVAYSWHEGKRKEKGEASVLGDPGPATPALLAAFLIGRKVSAFGFDWPDAAGVLAKVREETGGAGGGGLRGGHGRHRRGARRPDVLPGQPLPEARGRSGARPPQGQRKIRAPFPGARERGPGLRKGVGQPEPRGNGCHLGPA